MGKVVNFDSIDEKTAPKAILLDTSFLINLTHHITKYPTSRVKEQAQKDKHRLDCESFLKKLLDHKTRILTCDLVFSELCHEIYKDVLQRKDLKGWHNLYQEKPFLISSGHPKIERIKIFLAPFFDNQLQQSGDKIRTKAVKIMTHLDMCPNDSYIAAVAIENNLDGIANFNPKDYNEISKHYPINSYLPSELAEY